MPVNVLAPGSLIPGAVPPDRQCLTDGTSVLQLVADFMSLAISTQIQQGGTSDSVANQALQMAQTALALAQSVQAQIPQRRSNGAPISVPSGDSTLPITWTPSMPDTNYEVRGTFYGPAGSNSGAVIYVIDGTRTLDGCQIRVCNVPNNNFSFAFVVEDLSV